MNEKNQGESKLLGESFSRTTLTPHSDLSAYLHQPPSGTNHLGWYKPSRLPHFDQANIYQFITYHLADSIPQKKLRQFEIELKDTDPKLIHQTRRKMMENWLDAGHGICVLTNKRCAEIVLNAWHHFDNERYKLIAWTVMPNHVHVLIQQVEGYRLADIISSWKKFTARKINALIRDGLIQGDGKQPSDTKGSLWQRDYWDRFIRTEKHFNCAIEYILNNALKAGLAESVEEWRWCGTAQSEC